MGDRKRPEGTARAIFTLNGKTVNDLRHQEPYEDRETGLFYNNFRYYDPELGRYLSQDPIGLLGGTNLYSDVDSPTTKIDPWGLLPWRWDPDI
ncbi:MAG TPA: RHS repeat-associated core domain-containing protein [Blastocatellia bacterium]|nr:RHS repeat-associated core domain-containing protein [Blastocatellia bacterium]